MNVYNYDYPQTLKISKQHVHRSLCGHTEGRIISYNEMEKWGQVSHPKEQRLMQQLVALEGLKQFCNILWKIQYWLNLTGPTVSVKHCEPPHDPSI